MNDKLSSLTDASGHGYLSPVPGAWGGHRTDRVFGRLDCPAAARAIALGGYRANRVFFADADTAEAAGYRPCAVCQPTAYAVWRAARQPVSHWSRRSQPARSFAA